MKTRRNFSKQAAFVGWIEERSGGVGAAPSRAVDSQCIQVRRSGWWRIRMWRWMLRPQGRCRCGLEQDSQAAELKERPCLPA